MKRSCLVALLITTGCTCARAPVVSSPPPAAPESAAERLARVRAQAEQAVLGARDGAALQAAVHAWNDVLQLAPDDAGARLALAEAGWLAGIHGAAPAESFAAGARAAEEAIALRSAAFAAARTAGKPFAEAVAGVQGEAVPGLRWFARNQLAWAVHAGRSAVIAQRPMLEAAIAELEKAEPAEAAMLRAELLAALPAAAGGDRLASEAALRTAVEASPADCALRVRAALAWRGEAAERRAWLGPCGEGEGDTPEQMHARRRARELLAP